MKPLSPDTTVEAQRKHDELMGRLLPERRLAAAFERVKKSLKSMVSIPQPN
jgi:hypothetical protein